VGGLALRVGWNENTVPCADLLKPEQLGQQPYATINARSDRIQTAPTYRGGPPVAQVGCQVTILVLRLQRAATRRVRGSIGDFP
jgi:hypothetical protein